MHVYSKDPWRSGFLGVPNVPQIESLKLYYIILYNTIIYYIVYYIIFHYTPPLGKVEQVGWVFQVRPPLQTL